MYSTNSKITSIFPLLPGRLRSPLLSMSRSELREITELRLRRSRPFFVTACGREYALSPDGRLCNDPARAVTVTPDELTQVYRAALDNSIHSHAAEIREGFVTVSGGCRVGFCGTAVTEAGTDGRLQGVKDVSCINIRIAREVQGCAEELYNRTMSDGLSSLLLSGPPASGKTTVLRDLCRLLGADHRLAVIDERNELAAVEKGEPSCNVGLHRDIFTSYDKAAAIEMAVRTMSPEALVCDEIGSKRELSAYMYALGSGVRLIATCHASSVADAKRREVVSRLIKLGAFDRAAVLGTGPLTGRIVETATFGKQK